MLLEAMVDLGLPLRKILKNLRPFALSPSTPFVLSEAPSDSLRAGSGRVEGSIVERRTSLRAGREKGERLPRIAGELLHLVGSSPLDFQLKSMVLRVLKRLAQAEAKVHRAHWRKVRFHQLARPDTLINITGFCLGLRHFNVRQVYSSPIPVGSRHQGHDGRWRAGPGPATMELLKSFPIQRRSTRFEWTTPTGAALISTFATPVPPPPFQVIRIAHGFGTRRPPPFSATHPGALRLLLGRSL